MVLIFPPEPSKECVKVSHVIFECRVINHQSSSIMIGIIILNTDLGLASTRNWKQFCENSQDSTT